jgi:hypothetical protein
MNCGFSWLLVSYTGAAKSKRAHAAISRKLKGLGAVSLGEAVWLLPKTDDYMRRLRVVESEISAMKGECVILEAIGIDRKQEGSVVARFRAACDQEYQEFLVNCKSFQADIDTATITNMLAEVERDENDVNLKKLQRRLGTIRGVDYYGSTLGDAALQRMSECEALFDRYSQRVDGAHDQTR